jgi:ADP-ribose pyrophosphatase YjhB (NUDIX family)
MTQEHTNVALVIFLDEQGLLLLQQKTYDAPNFPGVWSLFGGHTEGDESPRETAKREIKEELDLDLPLPAFKEFKTFSFGETAMRKTRAVFVVLLAGGERLVLLEGRGMGYFSREEISHLSMPPHIRSILQNYFAQCSF